MPAVGKWQPLPQGRLGPARCSACSRRTRLPLFLIDGKSLLFIVSDRPSATIHRAGSRAETEYRPSVAGSRAETDCRYSAEAEVEAEPEAAAETHPETSSAVGFFSPSLFFLLNPHRSPHSLFGDSPPSEATVT